RRVPPAHPRQPAQLRGPADPRAVAPSHVRGRVALRLPRGPASVRALRREGHHRARRAHAGGAAQGLAGRELLAGRWIQGQLGPRILAMLSRVAESLYWTARYIERAEAV